MRIVASETERVRNIAPLALCHSREEALETLAAAQAKAHTYGAPNALGDPGSAAPGGGVVGRIAAPRRAMEPVGRKGNLAAMMALFVFLS